MSFFSEEKNVERIQSPGLRSDNQGQKYVRQNIYGVRSKNEHTIVKAQSTPMFCKKGADP